MNYNVTSERGFTLAVFLDCCLLGAYPLPESMLTEAIYLFEDSRKYRVCSENKWGKPTDFNSVFDHENLPYFSSIYTV